MSEDKSFLVVEASVLDAVGTHKAEKEEPQQVDVPYAHISVQQAVMGLE